MIYCEEETPYENLKKHIIGLKRFTGTEETVIKIKESIYKIVPEGKEDSLTKNQVLEIMKNTGFKGERIVFVNKIDNNKK